MRLLSYEELKGSSGREVWYRPPRYDARQLFPVLAPRVKVKSSNYQLHDISLGGIAVLSKDGSETELQVGEIVPVTIHQSEYPLFQGEARVCRTESNFLGAKIAFNFLNSFVEFDKLLNRNAEAQMALKASLFNTEKCARILPEYRALCSDTLSVLRSLRTLLDQNSVLAGQYAHGIDMERAFEACETHIIEQWRPLWLLGNDLARAVMGDRERRQITKEYTELVLTPEMRQGAIWDRSYQKPLGYPGDFEMMNQVYDWQRLGSGVYERLIHRVGLEVAECIRTRMVVVQDKIAETVDRKAQGGPARILSLGCGPAREVERYLDSPEAAQAHAAFTLIDQEQAALSQAYERTYPKFLQSQGRIHVQCLNISFVNILRGTGGIDKLPPQDLIYSVGLLDYLADRRAAQLVHRLYKVLAPGGTLIIGNMNETPLSNLWPMEFIADWTLEYRDHAQMVAWADGLDAATAWTETEPTGRVRLLYIRKN
jgi:extracellular factor (EF) 3-hydroxypalmitic acid methyl ester biosynthesis protein